jgi:hypothetical protein
MKIEKPQPIAPSQRAGRYPVQTPIRFRVHGKDQWHEGMTENISCTGVLLRSRFLPRNGAEVEMVLSLPAKVWGKRPAEVVGRGRVVRRDRSQRLNQPPAIAATIERYRLARKSTAL